MILCTWKSVNLKYLDAITKYALFIFRSLTLDYVEDVDHLGVTSKRFMTTNMTFANGTENPANGCFDTVMKLASGAQDISECQYGMDIIKM